MEVKKALKSLDESKATGNDLLAAKYLKLASNGLACHLSEIINTSITKGVFSDLWKSAKVLPIFKNGDNKDMDNYRPISILNILSKIIESHVHNAFYAYLNNHDLISKYQSGFRKSHSCDTGLATLLSNWHKHIDNNDIIGNINIDLRKAFDLLNHGILCKKLEAYGCREITIKWFHSYLYERKQNVFIEKTSSDFMSITHGIPQGSILGPLIFILYINDLPLCLKNGYIHMYADDTSLYVVGKSVENLN